nr:hypothetical protein [Cytophagales bacterium]
MGGEGNTYDYGFRIYNPTIAKFLRVDPLAKEFPWYTPYQFGGNKPIVFIDLYGTEFQLPTFEKFKYGELAPLTLSLLWTMLPSNLTGS